MVKLCLAILAHNNRPCLEDFVLNVHTFAPSADVLLFNGGRDPALGSGLDVRICPYSRPLTYERVASFHYEIMRWLHEERRDYDFLVTLDSDMLLLKPGLDAYLEKKMANSAYMAVDYQEVDAQTSWVTGRRFRTKWKGVWQPIFGTVNPYGCFNPGQVFRKEFADRLWRFPKLDELLARIQRSSLRQLEEIVWATMAATLDCSPQKWPSSVGQAVRYLKWHSALEIEAYIRDPEVFFIHPIHMDMNAPDRRLVRAIRNGEDVDFKLFQRETEGYRVPVSSKERLRVSLLTPILAKAHEAYLRVMPE